LAGEAARLNAVGALLAPATTAGTIAAATFFAAGLGLGVADADLTRIAIVEAGRDRLTGVAEIRVRHIRQ
jgi:hypothetical protein